MATSQHQQQCRRKQSRRERGHLHAPTPCLQLRLAPCRDPAPGHESRAGARKGPHGVGLLREGQSQAPRQQEALVSQAEAGPSPRRGTQVAHQGLELDERVGLSCLCLSLSISLFEQASLSCSPHRDNENEQSSFYSSLLSSLLISSHRTPTTQDKANPGGRQVRAPLGRRFRRAVPRRRHLPRAQRTVQGSRRSTANVQGGVGFYTEI